MRSEMPKTLLILGLTLLLCIAFNNESSVYGLTVIYSTSACSSTFFETLSCNLDNEIRVLNALYGYSYCDDPGGVCCPRAIDDCFLSIPSNNFDYYQTILGFCDNRVRCRPYANSTDADVTCYEDIRQQSDYVRLEYMCVPSSKTSTLMTATVCTNSPSGPVSTTISCAENQSISFVGAILGFQNSAEEACSPGEDSCRVQPGTDHLDCIETTCSGQQSCTIYAADSAPASHTCNEFVYMYENITYYCDDKEPVSPVRQVEESCWSLSSTTTLANTESPSSSLTSTLTHNTASTLTPNTASTLTHNTASTLTHNTASTLTPNTASTLAPNTASTLSPNTASTLAQSTGVEVSLPSIIASTTAEPDSEDGDNTAAIIGLIVVCALVTVSVIAGVTTAIIMRKRRASGKNRHDHLEPDSESPTPSFSGIDNEAGPQFNNPPSLSTQAGGHGVNQGTSSGQASGQSGVNSMPQERMSRPNGRRNDRNDKNNGSNKDDEPLY